MTFNPNQDRGSLAAPAYRLGLVGLAALLVLTWLFIWALTTCLNESPRFAGVSAAAAPGLWTAARWVLALVGPDRACEPSMLARALGLASAAYLGSIVLLDGGRVPRRLALGTVVSVALVCHALLFATPALLSTDILDYAAYGRVAAVYSGNPYVVPPEAFPSDALAGYGAWQGVVTVYGPLWTDIDALIARVLPAGDPVRLVLAYKGLALVAQLANLALVWWLVGRHVASFAVFALNPVVVLELVGNGHNDTLMIFFVLLALVPLRLLASRGAFSPAPLGIPRCSKAQKSATQGGFTPRSGQDRPRGGVFAGEVASSEQKAGPPLPDEVARTRDKAAEQQKGPTPIPMGFAPLGSRKSDQEHEQEPRRGEAWLDPRGGEARLWALALVPLTKNRGDDRYWLAALALLMLGAAVKFVPAAVVGFVLLGWGRRWRTLVLAGGVLGSVVLLVSWPWLTSADVLRPLQGIASGGQRFKDGWQDAAAAWIAVRVLPQLGVPAEPATVREDVSRAIAWGVTRAIFVVYLVFEVRHVWRSDHSLAAIVTAAARSILLAVLLLVTQVYPWYFVWPLPLVALLGWCNPLTKAVVAFGLTFLSAYYLREFQSYGVFYVPLYAVGALVLLALTWGGEQVPAMWERARHGHAVLEQAGSGG